MKYLPPLTGKLLEAYLSMPKLDGFVVALPYVPANRRAEYERAWGEWLRANPRELWPEWVDRWIDQARKQAT